MLVGTPTRVLRALSCLDTPLPCHLLWLEEANALLRRKGRKEVEQVLAELEGELVPMQRFDHLQGLIVTYSRPTRDVCVVTGRLPAAQVLEELPLLLTPERLVQIHQVVKWVELQSRRKQALRMLHLAGCEAGRKATVRVASQEELKAFELKVARWPAVSVTLDKPPEDCDMLVYASAPRFETYERDLAYLHLPALVVLLVSATDEALFPQLRAFLQRCGEFLTQANAGKNTLPMSWR